MFSFCDSFSLFCLALEAFDIDAYLDNCRESYLDACRESYLVTGTLASMLYISKEISKLSFTDELCLLLARTPNSIILIKLY